MKTILGVIVLLIVSIFLLILEFLRDLWQKIIELGHILTFPFRLFMHVKYGRPLMVKEYYDDFLLKSNKTQNLFGQKVKTRVVAGYKDNKILIIERAHSANQKRNPLVSSESPTSSDALMMEIARSLNSEMISARTKQGLADARAKGRVGGRREKLTHEQKMDIIDNVRTYRKSANQMARLYNVSRSTVYRILSQKGNQ